MGIQFDKTAVEPRIGFAWKVLGRQNTALRGGYAIFHDSSWNQGGQGVWESPPFFFESGQLRFPGGCGARPDQICDPNSGHQSISHWFNTSCLVPAGTTSGIIGGLGNASRTPASGPNFVNTDLSFIKRFLVTERVGLDFRAEFFNLFNHAQFGLPGSDLAAGVGGTPSSQFGVINTTVNNPRLVQFALKLNF